MEARRALMEERPLSWVRLPHCQESGSTAHRVHCEWACGTAGGTGHPWPWAHSSGGGAGCPDPGSVALGASPLRTGLMLRPSSPRSPGKVAGPGRTVSVEKEPEATTPLQRRQRPCGGQLQGGAAYGLVRHQASGTLSPRHFTGKGTVDRERLV